MRSFIFEDWSRFDAGDDITNPATPPPHPNFTISSPTDLVIDTALGSDKKFIVFDLGTVRLAIIFGKYSTI